MTNNLCPACRVGLTTHNLLDPLCVARRPELFPDEVRAASNVPVGSPPPESYFQFVSRAQPGPVPSDLEPQPEDGPDYHANHAAWRARHPRRPRPGRHPNLTPRHGCD